MVTPECPYVLGLPAAWGRQPRRFRSDKAFWPILATQRADTEALAADAETRGWGDEAARHRRLIERLDRLMAQAELA